MNIILVLTGISLSIAIGFLFLFIWNVRSGQYDDTYTPSVRILFEDKPEDPQEEAPDAPKKPNV
jgi:cbb3-type cytochrome oxidase maturation protein